MSQTPRWIEKAAYHICVEFTTGRLKNGPIDEKEEFAQAIIAHFFAVACDGQEPIYQNDPYIPSRETIVGFSPPPEQDDELKRTLVSLADLIVEAVNNHKRNK